MVPDILIPLIVVGLAELGDKTQLSTLLLASKTDKHLHLLLGIILAFLIMVLTGVIIALSLLSVIAIYSGKFISDKVNRETITTFAGISFILMGVAFFLF
nr:conserved hypothetical membrane protein, UPF0016 family [uncultured archaeon]